MRRAKEQGEERKRERERRRRRKGVKGLTEGAKNFCVALRYGMCAIKEVGFQFDERAVPAHKAGRAALAEAAAAAGLACRTPCYCSPESFGSQNLQDSRCPRRNEVETIFFLSEGRGRT